MLNEGNQIHSFILWIFVISFYYGSGSGSGTVINYGSGSDFLARYGSGSGSGSGSASQKVTVFTVPFPQRCLQAGGAGRPCRQRPDPRGSRHSATRLNTQIYTRPLGFILLIDCRWSTVVLGSGWGRVMTAFVSRSVGDPWHFGADPYLWLIDPNVTVRMQKKLFSYYRRHIFFSLKNLIFAKILCYSFIFLALFESAQHLYEKREGSGAGSIPLTNEFGSPARKLFSIQNFHRFGTNFSRFNHFCFKILD